MHVLRAITELTTGTVPSVLLCSGTYGTGAAHTSPHQHMPHRRHKPFHGEAPPLIAVDLPRPNRSGGGGGGADATAPERRVSARFVPLVEEACPPRPKSPLMAAFLPLSQEETYPPPPKTPKSPIFQHHEIDVLDLPPPPPVPKKPRSRPNSPQRRRPASPKSPPYKTVRELGVYVCVFF